MGPGPKFQPTPRFISEGNACVPRRVDPVRVSTHPPQAAPTHLRPCVARLTVSTPPPLHPRGGPDAPPAWCSPRPMFQPTPRFISEGNRLVLRARLRGLVSTHPPLHQRGEHPFLL